MAKRLAEVGLGCKWADKNKRSYGGLAGPETSRMVGKVSWPFVVVLPDQRTGGCVPNYMSATTNVVEGNTNFLMGLDLQRVMRI